MKILLVLGSLLLVVATSVQSQDVFDPTDSIVRFDASKPYGSVQHPDTNQLGLQKWVSKPTSGVSYGSGAYDASSYKQYFLNTGKAKVAFRIKYPKSYTDPDSASKKYPVSLFLHAGGEVGCPSNGGFYNNERQIWLGGALFKNAVDNNKFDGFLVAPQFVVYEGCFAGWLLAPYDVLAAVISMIDSLAKYARVDIDRVTALGPSGGGYGAWRMAELFPRRIAKILPSAASGRPTNREVFVHIPIWFATGGKDLDPSPEDAQAKYLAMKNLGANIRYTLYTNKGHSMWNDHWNEKGFIDELNTSHKANPLVFFGRSGYCDPDDIDAKLGITAGFRSYEWQKDGVTIASWQGGASTFTDNTVVTSFTGNEIVVNQFGTYRVRFKRTDTSEWSVWSPVPAVIKPKTVTQTQPIKVKGARSKVLPALDGSTTVPLTLADGFIEYRWFNAENEALLDTNQVFETGVGIYKGQYAEEFGCGAELSQIFRVVDAGGSPKPDGAADLVAVPLETSVVQLNWTDGGGETGYEIYRATNAGGPYTFVALTTANATQYRDSNLVNNLIYYYVVRAVSETGAAPPSNEAIAKTLTDNTPPTAPANLQYSESSGPTAVTLKWDPSTDNSGTISRYDIYINGRKMFSSAATVFLATGLDSLIPYRFTVMAVDSSQNVSAPSNQVTYLPPGIVAGDIPSTPSGIAASAVSFNSVKIVWADTVPSATGYEIVRASQAEGPYLPVGTVDKNRKEFLDSALSASETYFYKVRAIGTYGESAFSNPVSATTKAAPATPIAPTQLKGKAGENGTISIDWVDNSSNETQFLVYKSTDNQNYTEVVTLPPNSNAWIDTAVAPSITYYYYVAGRNAFGIGEKSNTIYVKAGNQAPEFQSLNNLFVKAGSILNTTFSVVDAPVDTVTLSVSGKPAFVTVSPLGDNEYSIVIAPGIDDVGHYVLNFIATDDNGLSTTKTVALSVGDRHTRSVYVNFGSSGKSGPNPWNNWLGKRDAGNVLTNLKDETGAATTISVATLNAWSGTTNLGHITGANNGVFPDAVLASGLVDSTNGSREIKISGLDPSKQYNLVFAGSQNEGIMALATYTSGGQTAALNARYNTDQTANLNNLSPNADGEILVTITRTGASPATYLNALVIEELTDSVQLLNPNNLYAEVIDRNSVRLTWSDRTNLESVADGYELVRATDSLFTTDVQIIPLPQNTVSFVNTGLKPNTKYWFRVRAKNDQVVSDYSNIVKVVTPDKIIYVNFNVTVPNAPDPWNNLESSPQFNFNTPNLLDQSGDSTAISLTLVEGSEFNGEFTAGVETAGDAGVAPPLVLKSNYWLDREQLGQFRVNGLNHSKLYRFGFLGSSSPPVWFKGNYTATYTVRDRTVYLNSWENASKIVYIGDVAPDPDGTVVLSFSTTPEAGYGFNSGLIIEEYNEVPRIDTPVDVPPVNPGDSIPGNPTDTLPGTPGNPTDTIPGTPGNPTDTLPQPPGGPTDTIPGNPAPDSDSSFSKVWIYPNPVGGNFRVKFYNESEFDKVDIEIYDPEGRLAFRRHLGTQPKGTAVFDISSYEANMRTGIYLLVLKVNGKIRRTEKLLKSFR